MTRLAIFVCTFGYLGYVPFAPGTVGSAAGVGLQALLHAAGGSTGADALTIVLLFAAGAWSGTIAERHFGTNDPGHGVIDEVMGMLITLFLVPVGWVGMLTGFALFRVFDVVKPYPAGRLERLPGGIGMMADDAMAAIYANLALRVSMWAMGAW